MSEVDVSKMVFLRHYLLVLARADARLLPEERALLEAACPPNTLRELGLLADDDTLTARWVEELDRARRELPGRLTTAAKLDMITTFVDMAVIDGDLHHEESVTLQEAASALGLEPQQFDAHLDALTDQVGQVEGSDLETDDD